MFYQLGQLIRRTWPLVLAFWLVMVIWTGRIAPHLVDVVETADFSFLPHDSPSRIAERLFAKSFPNDDASSMIVLVVRRLNPSDGLMDGDWDFVDRGEAVEGGARDLRQHLVRIAQEEGGLRQTSEEGEVTGKGIHEGKPPLVSMIRTFRDRSGGNLLKSEDSRATLVVMELSTEFFDVRNMPLINRIQSLLGDAEFRSSVPPGLDLSLSGTAVVGCDMVKATRASAKRTEQLTVILVVFLLVAIYRAPLLAIIPLVTVVISVKLTMHCLCIMATWGWVTLFQEVESYVTVLLYGAGVDYCLFLIARYKEELDEGHDVKLGLVRALGHVGEAISASAGTVICGIGMMIFALFGKFNQAGVAISFGLIIVLAASLTLTPALLFLTGRWAFWPTSMRHSTSGTGWLAEANPWREFMTWMAQHFGWNRIGQEILHQPGRIWCLAVGLMTPWALLGLAFYTNLSYGLLSDLRSSSPSVEGAKAVADHFPPGATGPLIVLVENPKVDFGSRDGEFSGYDQVRLLTEALRTNRADLDLHDIRSFSHPLGGERNLDAIVEEEAERAPALRRAATRKLALERAQKRYVGQSQESGSHVTRLELIADVDPFSRGSIAHLSRIETELYRLLPKAIAQDCRIYLKGSTSSLRDLKSVTDRDQLVIDCLVVISVFLVLYLLLKKLLVCVYLIVTVLFSYLATLGVTYAVFWLLDPSGFSGLDWKVPMFLFTILIAVGEDYNIFLMTRIEEEQRIHGPVQGVIVALSKTGGIISSCGIIMAGTFASLMAGTLLGMVELGFALAFGVLLDTYVVRPILVPVFLVMLYGGKLGILSRWAGYPPAGQETITPA